MSSWLSISLLPSTALLFIALGSPGATQSKMASPVATCNSKEQLTSVYPVASKFGQEAPGGYGPSQNRPHRLVPGETLGDPGRISLVVIPRSMPSIAASMPVFACES
jgi:hypothetical protein